MSSPNITAYLKTHCGWSRGVRAALEKYNLPYTEKDVVQSPEFRVEMEQISGQSLTPCVLVGDVLLADVSGAELESYLLQQKLVAPTDHAAAVPLHGCCSDVEHAAKGIA